MTLTLTTVTNLTLIPTLTSRASLAPAARCVLPCHALAFVEGAPTWGWRGGAAALRPSGGGGAASAKGGGGTGGGVRGGARSSGSGSGGGSSGSSSGGGVAGVLVLLEAEELEAVELALGSSEPRVPPYPLPLPALTPALSTTTTHHLCFSNAKYPPCRCPFPPTFTPPSPARQARHCVSVLVSSDGGGGSGTDGTGNDSGSGGSGGVGELRTAQALVLNPPLPHAPAAPSAAGLCLLRRAQEQFGSATAAAPLPRAAASAASSGGTWQHPADRGGGFAALPLDGLLAEVGVRLAEPWAAAATIRSVHAKLAAVDVVDSASLAAALDGGHGGLNALLRGRGHSALRAETLAVCSRLLRTQSYCLE